MSRGPRDDRRVSSDGRSAQRDGVVVPRAEFRSYYGLPVLKQPTWRADIPAYFFTGGLAAGCALMAAGADFTDRPALRRAGRLGALAAIGASTYFLINDLGRPERFYNMLRVVKPTSPMSVGTWVLAGFGPAAGLAAVSEAASLLPRRGPLGQVLPPAGRFAGYSAAALAPVLATYTAVLIADTAVPSWHEAYPELPFVFAGSALASAAGLGLLTVPPEQTGPARRLASAGAAIELAAATRVERTKGILGEPYRTGKAGRLLRAGRVLTAAGVAGAWLGRRSRVVSAMSGAALVVAAALTRFGIFAGGVASTRDPRYVVEPQRARLAAREAAAGDSRVNVQRTGSTHDQRYPVTSGDQLPHDRMSGQLPGDEETTGGLRVGE